MDLVDRSPGPMLIGTFGGSASPIPWTHAGRRGSDAAIDANRAARHGVGKPSPSRRPKPREIRLSGHSAVALMPIPLATIALASVIAFAMFPLPRTPAAAMPALPAFPRPVPAPGAVDGRVGVWNGRSLDEAARQDRHGHHHQDPRREPAHFAPLVGRYS